ncbi:hypothetical protein ACMG4P_04955 [Pseudovibrio denitrificans]|uniref:hypothetical protein n=1 Tax=Pseudovibrio denitrificans TaxID=258256 RepID=UPI0039BEFD8C
MGKMQYIAVCDLDTSKGPIAAGKKLPANIPQKELAQIEKLGGVIGEETDEPETVKVKKPAGDGKGGGSGDSGQNDPNGGQGTPNAGTGDPNSGQGTSSAT